MARRSPPQRREVHGLRERDRSTYFGFFLFGLSNPGVTSMRALCAATRLKRALPKRLTKCRAASRVPGLVAYGIKPSLTDYGQPFSLNSGVMGFRARAKRS